MAKFKVILERVETKQGAVMVEASTANEARDTAQVSALKVSIKSIEARLKQRLIVAGGHVLRSNGRRKIPTVTLPQNKRPRLA